MWDYAFSGDVTIYGVDINPWARTHESTNVHILIGDQSNRTFWRTSGLPMLDFILDDGGHTYEQQIVTFEALWEFLKPGVACICARTRIPATGSSRIAVVCGRRIRLWSI